VTGSKGTRADIRVTHAYTVTAVSAFFDRRQRRHRDTRLITLNYPRLRCLRLLVGPLHSATLWKRRKLPRKCKCIFNRSANVESI